MEAAPAYVCANENDAGERAENIEERRKILE